MDAPAVLGKIGCQLLSVSSSLYRALASAIKGRLLPPSNCIFSSSDSKRAIRSFMRPGQQAWGHEGVLQTSVFGCLMRSM